MSAMIFCGACHNLLYPESNAEKELNWKCAACGRVEVHNGENVVHTAVLKRELGELKERSLLAEFASDPTAQRDPSKACDNCGRTGVAAFINPLEQPTEDMTLFFACPHCKYVWKDDHE
eukprot:Tbor_TRINITY_DN2764_c0_g1::TRINITY_DN2764_c0_g1_i1::g.15230::m.15230/K03017/RPB9, POLR2I; DNA-directed RNA polymerase II subunit RPB9